MAVLKFKLEIKSVIFTCLLLCRFHCLSLSKNQISSFHLTVSLAAVTLLTLCLDKLMRALNFYTYNHCIVFSHASVYL